MDICRRERERGRERKKERERWRKVCKAVGESKEE